MKHVAFLIPTLDKIGGAERQVLALANGLLKRRWQVSVLTLSGTGGDAAQHLVANGASFQSFQMRKGLADPRGWLQYQVWARKHCPQIVHAHLPHAAWMARWSSLLLPHTATVDTIHTSSIGTLGRRLGYRWSNGLADKVTVVSKSVADSYLRAGMVSAMKLAIIPNGVDTDQYAPAPSARSRVRGALRLKDEFLWLTAGRLDEVKNYPLLLHVLASIAAPVHLAIAGAGPLHSSLRDLCTKLNLQRRVTFLGFQTDMPRWMQAADGFVLASQWEGLPLSLLEAGACGLPSVATDVPGSREVIADARNGFLAALNKQSLCDSMQGMMHMSAPERHAMGIRARENVLMHYSLGRVLDLWEALYAELIEKTKSTA